MARQTILEGTWEELKLHEAELSGKRFRLVPLASEPTATTDRVTTSGPCAAHGAEGQAPRRLTGLGKFAGIIPSSEDFIREKQNEIELEEQKFRP